MIEVTKLTKEPRVMPAMHAVREEVTGADVTSDSVCLEDSKVIDMEPRPSLELPLTLARQSLRESARRPKGEPALELNRPVVLAASVDPNSASFACMTLFF